MDNREMDNREKAIKVWTDELQQAIEKIRQAQQLNDNTMLNAIMLISNTFIDIVASLATSRDNGERKRGELFIKVAFDLLGKSAVDVYNDARDFMVQETAYRN